MRAFLLLLMLVGSSLGMAEDFPFDKINATERQILRSEQLYHSGGPRLKESWGKVKEAKSALLKVLEDYNASEFRLASAYKRLIRAEQEHYELAVRTLVEVKKIFSKSQFELLKEHYGVEKILKMKLD